jgi:hypothetical protein
MGLHLRIPRSCLSPQCSVCLSTAPKKLNVFFFYFSQTRTQIPPHSVSDLATEFRQFEEQKKNTVVGKRVDGSGRTNLQEYNDLSLYPERKRIDNRQTSVGINCRGAGGKKTQNKIKTKQEIQQLITYPTITPLLLINPPPPSFLLLLLLPLPMTLQNAGQTDTRRKKEKKNFTKAATTPAKTHNNKKKQNKSKTNKQRQGASNKVRELFCF